LNESSQPLSKGDKLEEERDFLLRSLDDLDREYVLGELSDQEYETLRDDYIRRTAAVVRVLNKAEPLEARSAISGRVWWRMSIILLVGALLGLGVAQFSGLRSPGETISGQIDQSPRNRLSNAQSFFFAGDLEAARAAVEEILRDSPAFTGALVLSAQLHERAGDPLPAIRQLDQVLRQGPEHVDALTLRGWILVRIDNQVLQEEGIRNLDKAVSLQPDSFDPYVFRGFVAREIQGDLELAIRMYELALDRDPPPEMGTHLKEIVREMKSDPELGE
jgi:tetratricopeptide (TPR) repeat protein|tara:strand:- start:3319 stop:4146 length:828 start_codon:yes stop_codon:yes gene_type:complete